MQITTVGLDLAKRINAVNACGGVVVRKALR